MVFTDLPWLIKQIPLREQVSKTWLDKERYTRLFALGLDAHQLYPKLNELSNDPSASIEGMTGNLKIVARRHNILAFIEVKYRSNKRMGGAIASLTPLKQKRIIHSAQVFLQTYPTLRKLDCRFDLIAVEGRNGSDSQVQIQWLENAFITLG